MTKKLSASFRKTIPAALKESHKRNLVIERRVRERILAESTARLILEVLDKEDLKQATKVLDKLSAIEKIASSDPNLKDSLGAAIADARNEVNDFTGGGLSSLMKKGTTAIAQKFGAKAGSNPILKATMLLNAIETGLKDMVSIVKNNAPNFNEKSKESLMQQLDDNGVKNVNKNLKKSFVPEGIFAKLKSIVGSSGGGMPYVKSIDELVDHIMMMPATSLVSLIRTVTSNPVSNEIQDTVKDMAQPSGGKPGGAPQGPVRPVTTIDALATSIAAGQSDAKGKDSGEAVEKAKENPKAPVKEFIKYVASKSKQDEETVTKVITALLKKGKIKSSFAVAEGASHKSRFYTLTMNEILDAQMALLKSCASTKSWVKNLFEIEVPEEIKGALEKNKDGKEFIEKLEKDEEPTEGEVIALKNIVKNLNLSKDTEKFGKEIDSLVGNLKASSGAKRKKEEFKKKIENTKSIEDMTDILDEMDPDGKKTIGDTPIDLIIKLLNQAEDRYSSAKSSKDKKEAIRGLKRVPDEIDFVKLKARDILVNSTKDKDSTSGKYTNIVKSVQEDLEGIDPKSIEAILDVLPDYLRLENKKSKFSVI
jgi:hypothetical protein